MAEENDVSRNSGSDIDVSSISDTQVYYITGSAVLPNNKLVLVDWKNDKVKLVDIQDNKLIDELELLSRPWDITAVSQNKVAVTLPDKGKILLLDVKDRIEMDREIPGGRGCHGVAFFHDKLVVSYGIFSPHVKIIDLSGNVIRTIEIDSDDMELVPSPHNVCVSNDGYTIYVTDWTNNTVTSLTSQGEVMYVCKLKRWPLGVCSDKNGNVYICSRSNVHMITNDCNKVEVILTRADGLNSDVTSVSHCQDTNRLFIGMNNTNYIRVFKLPCNSDIDVSASSDILACHITGSAVLPNNKLVLVDRSNDRVKLVDIEVNKVISKLNLPSTPWDITAVSQNKVAITLPYSCKILLLDRIEIDREIHVGEGCRGVAYIQDRLVVTYACSRPSSHVNIIDLHGNVKWTIETGSDGRKLFTWPEHVCVSNDGDTIYVSDYGRDTVSSLTLQGDVKSVYEDEELRGPLGVCTDQNGNVYVRGGDSRNVHMITADCKKVKVILSQADGLNRFVASVSHCQDTNRLFIGRDAYQLH